ncbi:MAG: hypothetical protein K2P94_08805 [Rhodospirillaceae bacterium]|nr:hypothetical protein [Rhodospirillaceae bacterium]
MLKRSVIIAAKFEKTESGASKIDFQRPLCVYPKMPQYKSGPRDSAYSFVCAMPKGVT